jgi:hypothetical protein
MPVLNKAQALKVERRKFKDVDVPELGGQLRLASISAGCGLRLKDLEMGEAGDKNQREGTLAMFETSIVDEDGKPLFTAEEAEQFLSTISTETLGLIVSAITSLSGKAAKTNGVEVPAANPSAAAQSGASPTA